MAERGYALSARTLHRIHKWLRKSEKGPVASPPPTMRLRAAFNDGFPLRLAKPESGQTLDGSTPGTSASCGIWAGVPGSEVLVESGVPIYPGQAMGTGQSIDDTTYFLCGDVNGYLQFVMPIAGGSATSGGMITVLLPSNLALTDATKAGCTVKATFSGGPTVDVGTVTVTNPPAIGGNYQWQATAATQYVNAIFQGGSTYLICGVQQVLLDDPLTNFQVDGSVMKLQKKTRDAWVSYVGTESGWTDVHTGTSC